MGIQKLESCLSALGYEQESTAFACCWGLAVTALPPYCDLRELFELMNLTGAQSCLSALGHEQESTVFACCWGLAVTALSPYCDLRELFELMNLTGAQVTPRPT
uniref:Rab-GAP TBC domain-containing protein n=1 Tax=Ascaris lumbricoides TaxID=6252 RepID=A0A0M3I8D2_ASCLU